MNKKNTKLKKVYYAPVIKLFLRLLKDNNIILDKRAYEHTFGYRYFLQTMYLPSYYIARLVELNLMNYDKIESINLHKFKLNWLNIMQDNYKKIKTKARINDSYLSPANLDITLVVPTMTDLKSYKAMIERHIEKMAE